MDLIDIERVFIIGAGVSIHCGYPLNDDLLKKITLKATDEDKFYIHNFLNNFYPTFSQTDLNYPNIEDFMSLLDIAIKMGDEIPARRHAYYVKSASQVEKIVLINIYNYFTELLEKTNSSMKIYDLSRYFNPNDVIISFNWDLNIEKALEDHGKKYSYYLDRDRNDEITILKPHGSMNWFKRDEVKFKRYRRYPLINSIPKGNIDVFTRLRKPNISSKEIVIPYIIPPTMIKARNTPEIIKIWDNSHYVLSHTKEIIILGYSLPDYDLSTRFVLRDAILKNNHFSKNNPEKKAFNSKL
jgi:hypothetical protein